MPNYLKGVLKMAAINIVLKAVDDYSKTLTGLNQGFELVGKGISAMATVAAAAWDAIKLGAETAMAGVQKAVDLAVKGGDFSEMKRQFDNVAESFGVNGDKIIKNLEGITQNVIGVNDAVKLAGKGIAAGFGEEALDKVFTFVKRRTELTGEDFNQMAETMINALAKGRFSTLKEFGLIIEKGASVDEVLNQIATATKKYGDAGFNTADQINALTNQQEKFYTKIGAAINASEQWQKAFTTLTDAVVLFVNNLDPDFITDFTDVIVEKAVWATGKIRKVLAEFYDYFYDTISDFAKVIRDNPVLYDFLGYDIEYWSKLDASMMRVRRQIDGTTTALKEARSAAQKALNDAIVKDAESQFKAFNDTGREINEETKKIVESFSQQTENIFSDLDEIEAGLEKPTDIVDRQSRPQNQGSIQNALAQANWPAEFAALGEFMFKWVLSVASGSSLPMAVTTQ